ncbi:MAG: pyruvate carboxylase [Eubacteriales bacterium]|nr:pyruvate carboxylase [Eubacteriales bacterium]
MVQEIKKFKKVLVANRGEIAIRIFQSLNELGISSIGIYSKEDRFAMFRSRADEAYPLRTDKGPVDAYLDIQEIIRIAKERKADAIHPGYGFLSENPDLAEACAKNGIVFIGPNAEAMNIMGDKISAKQAAAESKVPILPGCDFALKTWKEAAEIAEGIGYPVMLKASNGGGGRGMSIVLNASEMETAFEKASNESKRAFGESKLFIEKYLTRPKHIEVQILGDNYGNIVHLYDRDCSIQRRNQKIIEFAPAWSIPDDTRKKILDSAKRLARRVGYSNAGTMEFLVDENNQPYFIEMNPRVQVEHTVTEMITGIDIVTTQILVAEGYPLNSRVIHIYSQNEVKCDGYAIQARVTTEDPMNNFLPDYGKIDFYQCGSGSGIRFDAGNAYAGAIITSFYDSLLVKTISHGRTFENAISKLVRSLKEFRIHGVKTNISFLINVLNHPLFAEGKGYTTFIDETPELFDLRASLDRTTKILEFLANKMVNVNYGQKPLLEDRIVPVIDESIKIHGMRDEWKRLGTKEFIDRIKRSKKLYISDTTMRDAQQSLLATRMRTKEVAGAARATNLYLKDAFSIEAWGGATYDTAYRYLKESPWKRLALLRERMPNVMIQMLLRSSNVVGYNAYPDNVVEKFIKVSAYRGIDIYRIFDSMNWIENMKLPIQEVLKNGKIAEGTVCYSGDLLNPTEKKYTLDYYVDLARQLEAEGCHIISVKDPAGLLKPYAAKELITALKGEVKTPIHLHTHDTSGNGIATYLMAAEAGVDIVDCAIGSMSTILSQPSMNALVESLRGTPRDTMIDRAGLDVLDRYYSHERQVYQVFETGLKSPNIDLYNNQIPGGQYSSLCEQVQSMGLTAQLPEICHLYKDADEILGNIIKVTPTSKVAGDLAIFMLRNGLTKENIFEKGQDLSYPESVIRYLRGMLGQPAGGFPERFQKMVLKDQTIINVRPGALLPDVDFDKIEKHLRDNYYNETMEDERIMEQKVLSYALYPHVYDDYCQHFEAYNDVSKLESHVYFYGLRPGEETTFQIEDGVDTLIKFISMSDPDDQGYRSLQFEVNGFYREIRILDKHYEIKADNRLKTDKKNPKHLGASLPGRICEIAIREGDRVEKGMQLMVIEAMKMETVVRSHVSGYVDKIYVKNGDDVTQDALLVSFQLDEEENYKVEHPKLPEMDLSLLDEDELKTVSIIEK